MLTTFGPRLSLLKTAPPGRSRATVSTLICSAPAESDHITEQFFFVKEKNERLSMVADCRRSNVVFSKPAAVKLATGDAFGSPLTHTNVPRPTSSYLYP